MLFLLAVALPVFSQPLFVTRNMQHAYDNGTRSTNGKPGKNYWQNRGDYTINVSFDPKTLLVKGDETISYSNNSPDSLKKLIIRLYPDYYKRGVFRNDPIDEKDENDGVTIEFLEVGNDIISLDTSKKQAVHDQTNLIIHPKNLILPHSTTTLAVRWHYTLNSGSQNRTGTIDSSSAFIAYFFPRIAVYDDVDGWDEWSYAGIQEFYNDFGDFNVSLTVPKGFMVWATGELKNESEVIAPEILSKWNQAQHSSKIVHVIDSNDYKKGIVTTTNAFNTWKFTATNITDFVFAVSNHYLWDACSVIADKKSGRTVTVQTAYNKSDKDYFDVINQAQFSVQVMCDSFPAVPFPFPHITVVDGTDQMEYPMMVNDNPTDARDVSVQLTSHEIFHSYFPFYMGIDETKYGWMDEGWATIGESVISPMLDAPEDDGIYRRAKYELIAGTKDEVPMITNSQLITGETYYCNSYGKPAECYWILWDMLGSERFFKALHAYMDDWNGKHPTPYDFFNEFNTASGEDLNWFWKAWFYDWGVPDLAISSVKIEKGKLKIIVDRKGNIPVPVTLQVTLADGTVIKQHETAEKWADGTTSLLFQTAVKSDVVSVILGDEFTPDVNRKDNEWKK